MMQRAMAPRTISHEDINNDYMLALQLSEGVDQFGPGGSVRQGCDSQELDEDILLALKLSEETGNSGMRNGDAQLDLDDDFLLALKLSDGFNQSPSGLGLGQFESDAAFAQRLERELAGDGLPEEPKNHSSMVSKDTSDNVAVLREWYAGTQGQASKLADLFQHLNYLDDIMLRDRSGLRLTTEVRLAPTRVTRQKNNIFRQPNNIFRLPKSTSTKPVGTGFSNGFLSTSSSKPCQVASPKIRDSEVDQKITGAFDFLSANLYDLNGWIGQGRRVPVLPIVSAMLDLSLFSETTEMILRNDSIKDLSERLGLVKSLLRLLKTMSMRDEYRSVLTRPRRLKKRTKGLKEIVQSSPGTAVPFLIVLEDEKEPKSQPLFDLLSRLKSQAEVYLKGARSSNDGAFRLGEAAVSVGLCEHIVEVHDSMLNTTGLISPPTYNSGKGRISLSRPSWQSTLVVAPVSEYSWGKPKVVDWSSAILDMHCFKQDAQQIVSSLPGRQPKLVRQVTELTNLPEGIFVRVMEARPDVLKALIVGPKDTPYEGGLFEFDIFAPADFPTGPPRVALKTTGNGRVRFNPNLYADGKVCLSLINTWQGSAVEKWQPGSSTLLQVLVSIQSMVFVECPYINEPGREGLAGQAASNQHKEFVRANTIRWGMIDWLQDASKINGIWKDVIRAHFFRNASQLRQLVRNSAASNVGIRHYHGNQSEDTLVRNPTGGMNLEKELDKCLSIPN